MSTPSAVLEAQLRSLLDLVEQRRAQECARVASEAMRQRSEILAKAHREARARMHEAILSERRRSAQLLESTRAQLRSRRREHHHRVALLMLHRGWESLREALMERWREPASQRRWCNNLLERATPVLPAGHWNIEHPSGWNPAAARDFARKVEAATEHVPTLSPNSDISAGLRICCATACLDATLGEPGLGLLFDRTGAEARLLAHLHHLLARREGSNGNGR